VNEQKSRDALEIPTRGHGDALELTVHITPTESCTQLELTWQIRWQILTTNLSIPKLKVNTIL
jgi:DNA recombination-dependent growth factor C